jgi:hypothetical protein
MRREWRGYYSSCTTILGLRRERILWALIAGAKGERIKREEWGRVQRDLQGWRGGRNLDEDTQCMWEERGRAKVTWATEVAPAIEQRKRGKEEGWRIWRNWAAAEMTDAGRNGHGRKEVDC